MKVMKTTTIWRLLVLSMIMPIGPLGCAIRVGDKAPNWTLKDTAGRAHSLSTYD